MFIFSLLSLFAIILKQKESEHTKIIFHKVNAVATEPENQYRTQSDKNEPELNYRMDLVL